MGTGRVLFCSLEHTPTHACPSSYKTTRANPHAHTCTQSHRNALMNTTKTNNGTHACTHTPTIAHTTEAVPKPPYSRPRPRRPGRMAESEAMLLVGMAESEGLLNCEPHTMRLHEVNTLWSAMHYQTRYIQISHLLSKKCIKYVGVESKISY